MVIVHAEGTARDVVAETLSREQVMLHDGAKVAAATWKASDAVAVPSNYARVVLRYSGTEVEKTRAPEVRRRQGRFGRRGGTVQSPVL